MEILTNAKIKNSENDKDVEELEKNCKFYYHFGNSSLEIYIAQKRT